jgi:protease-4
VTRRLVIWIFLLIILVALVATGASAGGSATASLAAPLSKDGVSYAGTVVQDGDGDKHVAIIPIYNAITDGDTPPDGSATGGDDVVRMLDAIADDADSWDAVILELDTPGGSVLASEEITDALARLKDETDLKVLSWMRGTAASAGYYISAPTDRIVASEHTFTGSIGVILEYYVAEELADKVGVEQVVIKSGKLKDIGNPLRAATPEERALFQTIIDEAYDTFVGVVADGRDLPEDEVRKLADGRIYTGKQAEKLGLVDTLGLRRTAYDEVAKLIGGGAKGEDLDVVAYARSYGFLESLGATAQPTLDSLAAARAVGGVLRGDTAAVGELAGASSGSRRLGSGFARLEYRAELG